MTATSVIIQHIILPRRPVIFSGTLFASYGVRVARRMGALARLGCFEFRARCNEIRFRDLVQVKSAHTVVQSLRHLTM